MADPVPVKWAAQWSPSLVKKAVVAGAAADTDMALVGLKVGKSEIRSVIRQDGTTGVIETTSAAVYTITEDDVMQSSVNETGHVLLVEWIDWAV